MRPTRRALVTALVVAGLVGIGLVVRPGEPLPWVRRVLHTPWFPFLLVGLYVIRPVLAWPITALSMLVGYRYGLTIGLPIALVGAVLTSLLPYGVARFLRPTAGPFEWLTERSERYFGAAGPTRGVVAARLAPTPAEAVSGAAGVAGVPVTAFVIGTAVGEVPWTVMAVLAGESMRRFSLGGGLLDPWLVLGGIAGAAAVLARPALRYLRGRRVPPEHRYS